VRIREPNTTKSILLFNVVVASPEYFDDYVQRSRLPVRCGVEVAGVEKRASFSNSEPPICDYEAKNFLIADRAVSSCEDPRPVAAAIPADFFIASMQSSILLFCPKARFYGWAGSRERILPNNSIRLEGKVYLSSACRDVCPHDIGQGYQ